MSAAWRRIRHITPKEGFGEPFFHKGDMPGNDAVCLQCILAEFGDRFRPMCGHHCEGILPTVRVVIDIDIVPWCFFGVGIAAAVGSGMIADEIDVALEEHGRRQH